MTRRLAALAFLLLLAAADAFARAGGGGGYHGSSGFHSSYGGGGGGGGDGGFLLFLYIRFVFEHPLIGLPLTAFVLYVLYSMNSGRIENREASIDSTITRGAEAELSTRRAEALAVIRARDPGFDEAVFLKRASGAFLAIQDAWSRQDLSRARAFISDGVHERFTRQIAEYRSRGTRNRMSGVTVLETEALGFIAGPHFDSVYVRIKASAVDEVVALEGGDVLSGGPGVFTEVWTLLRRPGAKTLARPGLLEGHCPSCGALLMIADAAQCPACKVWVNSAEHDWVLTGITQMSEWAFPSPDREVSGWAAMRESDPGLSLEALEDRAAVAFWRWLDARRRADVAPLRGIADDAFVAKEGAFTGEFERDAAVGAVETVAFERGAGFDKAHVQVRWEADRMIHGAGGEIFQGRARRTHYLVFRRKSGATSDLKAGLRASRCPACGAAPEQADSAACAYCGHAFNDGSVSWVLDDMQPFGMWMRPQAPAAAPDEKPGLDWGDDLPAAEAVSVLAAGLAAQGVVDAREKAFLLAYAARRDIEASRAEELLQAALQKRLDVPVPTSGAEAESILRGLIRMSLADGRISDEERALMSAFGGRVGLTAKDLDDLIKEERSKLHAQAKETLAAAG
ncbi:MAG TPA: TIM44-like domain-containing protein [Elusimicrobiota bacterium]|nr:TIM44-like domain-containing protein [Elusimicrobiota bacterium]